MEAGEFDAAGGAGGWHHYVYKVTCLKNGMVYYGVHSTRDLQDGYCGSGAELERARALYGDGQFRREILCWATSREKALEVEELIVNRLDPHNYNRKAGGDGGIPSCGLKPVRADADDPVLSCLETTPGLHTTAELMQLAKRDPHVGPTLTTESAFARRLAKAGLPKRGGKWVVGG